MRILQNHRPQDPTPAGGVVGTSLKDVETTGLLETSEVSC